MIEASAGVWEAAPQIIDWEPGTLVLKANARDIEYPRPGEPHQASEGTGMASVTITVA